MNTLLESAYKERSLSEATRKLVHQLFGDKGLVVIDADRKDLKGLATHLWSKELETSFSAMQVSEQNARLEGKGLSYTGEPPRNQLILLRRK